MSGDSSTNLDFLLPHNVLHVNESPVQRPGQDELLRTAVVGGPELAGDRRVYLSVEMLGKLMDVARSSPMQRVLVHRAGVRVDLYQSAAGHRYEVWTLVGANPQPEPVPDYVRFASSSGREG